MFTFLRRKTIPYVIVIVFLVVGFYPKILIDQLTFKDNTKNTKPFLSSLNYQT